MLFWFLIRYDRFVQNQDFQNFPSCFSSSDDLFSWKTYGVENWTKKKNLFLNHIVTARSQALGRNNSIGLMDLYRIEVSRIFHPIFLPSEDLFSRKTNGVGNLIRKKKKNLLKSQSSFNTSFMTCSFIKIIFSFIFLGSHSFKVLLLTRFHQNKKPLIEKNIKYSSCAQLWY